jgi:ABC-type nitrate/sulfonate/bicarbonate transport system substrate-binding protein
MKGVYFALLFLVVSGVLASAAETESDAAKYEVSELRYQGWASQVLLPELAEDLGYLAPIKLKWVGNTISGPQDIQSAVTGDTDFGGAFNGSIVKLIAARAPLKAVIAYYGADRDTYTGLYVLDDNPITTPHDLLGKKVEMNTLGAYQEYLLTDYLIRAGFTRDDVKQVTLVAAPPMNLAQMLR